MFFVKIQVFFVKELGIRNKELGNWIKTNKFYHFKFSNDRTCVYLRIELSIFEVVVFCIE